MVQEWIILENMSCVLEFVENISRFFSKVGGKIWGWEGYIGSNAKIVLQCLQENAMRAEVEIKTELGHFEFNLGAPQIYCQVKLSKAIKPLNINLKQIIFDKGVLAKYYNDKVKIPLN